MPRNKAFGELLRHAIHRIKLIEDKPIALIQDELGQALKRANGSAIEYWCRGNVPASLSDIEHLAQNLAQQAQMDNDWVITFLRCAKHPYPERFCTEIFGVEPMDKDKKNPILPSLEQLAPFVVGQPIIHPRQFFGRQSELRTIFGILNRFPLQHIAITGARRSGKTSLLYYIKNITTVPSSGLRAGQKFNWLTDPHRYHWIFVDFLDSSLCCQEGLFRYLLTEMNMQIPETCSWNTFKDMVAHKICEPVVILMDEIEAALQTPDFDESFWWNMRSLATTQTDGKLSLILTARDTPAQVANEIGKPSPFFNIFGHMLKLGVMKDAEAQDLIANSPIPFSSNDTEWIIEQSGRCPALIQILAFHCLQSLEDEETDNAWQEEGRRQIEPFRYLLNE